MARKWRACASPTSSASKAALLGFETIDTEGEDGHIGWARTHCEGGAVMFLATEEPMDPAPQAVLLYMYTPDLPALRAHLLAWERRLAEKRNAPTA